MPVLGCRQLGTSAGNMPKNEIEQFILCRGGRMDDEGGDNADVSFIRALDSSSPSCRDLPRMSCPGVTPI